MEIENKIEKDDFKFSDLLKEEENMPVKKKKIEKKERVKKSTPKVNKVEKSSDGLECKQFYGAALMNKMRMNMENFVIGIDISVERDKSYKAYYKVNSEGKNELVKIEEI